MILDVMSAYGMLKCMLPAGIETGRKIWMNETMVDMWFITKLLSSAVQFSSHLIIWQRLRCLPVVAPSVLVKQMASCNGIAARRGLSP